MRTNPGKNVTIYEVSSLVKEAQMVAMTPRNIMSGFCSTGKWPFNPQIFDETDFAPAFVTDRDIIQDSGSSSPEPQAFQSKLGNEQACNSSMDRPTSHRDNASGDVDQLANFLEKQLPLHQVLTWLLISYLLKMFYLFPKRHQKKILLEEVKQEYIPTLLFVVK